MDLRVTDDQQPRKTTSGQRAPRVVLMSNVIVQGVYCLRSPVNLQIDPSHIATEGLSLDLLSESSHE